MKLSTTVMLLMAAAVSAEQSQDAPVVLEQPVAPVEEVIEEASIVEMAEEPKEVINNEAVEIEAPAKIEEDEVVELEAKTEETNTKEANANANANANETKTDDTPAETTEEGGSGVWGWVLGIGAATLLVGGGYWWKFKRNANEAEGGEQDMYARFIDEETANF